MSFADLPPELQIHVFGYLDHLTLKAVRAVCRRFRDNASPALFRRAIACSRYLALSTLQKLSLHHTYASYVKEIVFDGSIYDRAVASSEGCYHRLADKDSRLSHAFPWQKHARFKRYQQLYQEQEELWKDGVLLAEVSRALEWLRNVSTLVYSPGPHFIPIEAKTMKDLLPRNYAAVDSLDAWRQLDAVSGSSYVQSSQHGIHHIIGAVYEAQYPGIREFRIKTIDIDQSTSGQEFTVCVFEFPNPVYLEAGKFFFQQLRKLEMNLSLRDHGSTGSRGLLMLSNLAALLGEAKGLEEMSFHLCHWRPTAHRMYGHIIPQNQPIFQHLGLRTTWSNLRFLSLGGVYAAEEELMDLITRHQGTLTELHFKYCSLFSGTWANMVDEIVFGMQILPFSLDHVNETNIGIREFRDLAPEEMEHWQYEGQVMVDSEGRRYFDEPPHKSVYAARSQSSEEN